MENTGKKRVLRHRWERAYVNVKRDWLGKVVSRQGMSVTSRNVVFA